MRKLTHEDCEAIFEHLPISLKRSFILLLVDVAYDLEDDPSWPYVLLWGKCAYKRMPRTVRQPKYKRIKNSNQRR